jgi:cysteine synthase
MIDLSINHELRKENIDFCRERQIRLPTLATLRDPSTAPDSIKKQLAGVALREVNPANLYRITWKNEPKEQGGGFGGVNHIVLDSRLTGVKAKIIAVVGKWFPIGAHKVGATYGCLVPQLVTGQFGPRRNEAAWPSTGNFCRGGAYVSALLGCKSIAILPEEMSAERFAWLRNMGGEVIATRGCESNVKEIFDKCWELKKTRPGVRIFNQFEEFGNTLWHYNVTGPAMKELLDRIMGPSGRCRGAVFCSGSAGTMAAGYYIKDHYRHAQLVVGEALQCPTLLYNGFGGHRIEGIGDKHVPWIHDVKNTDVIVGVDDEIPMRLIRLFNEPLGRKALEEEGVSPELVAGLSSCGISGIGNIVSAIKYAKYYEMDENDHVVTVLTDSIDLYGSRLAELSAERGAYNMNNAQRDLELLRGLAIDHVYEPNYYERKRIHNLKYFTWVEQQGKTAEELTQQWQEHGTYWGGLAGKAAELDRLIEEFNREAGFQ